ncbi:MAG: hypothetical protein ABSG91_10500 [Syntrophobacteraceae bacterium]|jgi:hypothetical protein
MDPVLKYFSENLATLSKEELLKALENALQSARHWREAYLRSSPEQLQILNFGEYGPDAAREPLYNEKKLAK